MKPDTSIQAYVCIGLNGIKEANWEQDYTLLQAFCFEAIFYGIMDNEESEIWNTFISIKQQSSEFYRTNLTSLDQYLEDVKLDLFERMRANETLRDELLAYYEQSKESLAFRIRKLSLIKCIKGLLDVITDPLLQVLDSEIRNSGKNITCIATC